MSLFDKFTKKKRDAGIRLAHSSHVAEEVFYGDGAFRTSFRVNDAFRPAKSHAGEVDMLHTYAPHEEFGTEGAYPYLALQCDDGVYGAVEAFRETGEIPGALELAPLSGTFCFRAKIEYYGRLMYFYGMDRCRGEAEIQGLCLVYPKALGGTEDERKLAAVLDEAAESFREEREA